MAATYNIARTTDIDLVRAALGDTDVSPAADALFQDEEIDAVLLDTGSVNAAVGQLAGELVQRFSREPTVTKVGDIQVNYASRIPTYERLHALFGTSAGTSGFTSVPATYGGGDAVDEYGRACRYWQ